jgi:integrase
MQNTQEEDSMKGCRPLSDEEVAVALKSFGGMYAARDKALFLFGIKSGFRISELRSLTVGDLWQYGRLVDYVTVHRRHMKKKVEGRTIVLHPDAKAVLTLWLAQLKAADLLLPTVYLFQSRKGINQLISRIQGRRMECPRIYSTDLDA